VGEASSLSLHDSARARAAPTRIAVDASCRDDSNQHCTQQRHRANMAQGLRAKPKKKQNPKKKPLTKRQRTGAAAKKTVRRKHHDAATKMINASVEKRVAGAAARGGQHFELGTVSDASKAACAEQRAAGKTSKKARRLEKAAEKAKAVAARQASERAYSWM
jgi:hypothetical protein